MRFLVALFAIATVASAQYLFEPAAPQHHHQHQQQHPTIVHAMHHRQMHAAEIPMANPAVVDNAIVESHLPAEYMRASNFYRNPRIAQGLAKESLLTDKEMPVYEREADKIPREQVFKLFKNAGFLH